MLLVLMRGWGGSPGAGRGGRWSGGRVAECESGSGESVAEQTPGRAQSSGHCIDTNTIPLYCDVIRISRYLMISSQLVRYLSSDDSF